MNTIASFARTLKYHRVAPIARQYLHEIKHGLEKFLLRQDTIFKYLLQDGIAGQFLEMRPRGVLSTSFADVDTSLIIASPHMGRKKVTTLGWVSHTIYDVSYV